MSYGAKKFKKTSIETASKEQILLMFYEGCIKSLKLAKKAIENNDIKKKCEQITKAHEIILELSNTLDTKQNAAAADQLMSLYDFCSAQLLLANSENSVEAIDNVIKVMTTLYEGWVAAVDEFRKNNGAQKI